MSASKRKSARDGLRPAGGDRTVYSEFGPATQRAIEPSATTRPALPASEQPLRVEASRKGRKGKTVSVITGFQARPETLSELSKKLKAQCGAGGAVKENTIEIQGDHRQQLVQILTQLGYPVKISGG